MANENSGLTLEPGEEPLPLEADGADGSGLFPSESLSGPTAIPQAEGPTDEGFETVPDYLTPQPNPLLTPHHPRRGGNYWYPAYFPGYCY
ncbi:MAG: hypothetical protein HC929_21820 [Leptolyngbyaceae cyanobacterium SM2_5_2]|nr:hypothetical protein [Leptolyngbyaceae cyanobacterium SM2_5_2]